MNIKQSVEQLESLIETWELNEADLNQTDINALMMILKENQELKKQLEERTKMYQNAYDYSQKMEGKTIILEAQQKEFIKFLENNYESTHDIWYIKILQKYKETIRNSND